MIEKDAVRQDLVRAIDEGVAGVSACLHPDARVGLLVHDGKQPWFYAEGGHAGELTEKVEIIRILRAMADQLENEEVDKGEFDVHRH